jgi:hypothetical protein
MRELPKGKWLERRDHNPRNDLALGGDEYNRSLGFRIRSMTMSVPLASVQCSIR